MNLYGFAAVNAHMNGHTEIAEGITEIRGEWVILKGKSMTNQTMLELAGGWDCEVRGLGYGLVKVMISGSVDSNPQFLVRLYATGDIRTVDQNDIRLYGNPSAGESLKPAAWENAVPSGETPV